MWRRGKHTCAYTHEGWRARGGGWRRQVRALGLDELGVIVPRVPSQGMTRLPMLFGFLETCCEGLVNHAASPNERFVDERETKSLDMRPKLYLLEPDWHPNSLRAHKTTVSAWWDGGWAST